MLFGRGQHALKADHEEIIEQVGINIFWATAHVILLEATDSFANGGFNFTLGFHNTPRSISAQANTPPWLAEHEP